MTRVSVVVVSYNTSALLHRCLASLDPCHDIIVVDNASSDDSVAMVMRDYPQVRLIENQTNRGFGAANNQGIAIAECPLVLLLNSDAYAEPGAIEELVQAFDNPEIVAAGGRLISPDGSTQESTAGPLTPWAVFCEQTLLEKLFPGSKSFSRYWRTRGLLAQSESARHETTQVMGACLMFRPVERFDERFFLYCEDTDLCLRLSRHGKIVYVPTARFGHELGGSSSSDRWRSVARYNAGKVLYFRIHHGAGAAFVCNLLNRLGALIRVICALLATILTLGFAKRPRAKLATFARVLFAGNEDPR